MNYTKEIDELINALKEELGEKETAEALEQLLSGGKVSLSRADVMKQILTGKLDREETAEAAKNHHIEEDLTYRVFLISFRTEYDDTVLSVLYSMFDTAVSDTVQLDETHIALIIHNDPNYEEADISTTARSIYDTLSSEALVNLRVSYDEPVSSIYDLNTSYENLLVAEKLGHMFFSERYVYGYHELGLGKLLYRIPPKDRIEYMKDNLPKLDFRELDEETLTTIRTFFDTGLSIAETARRLFLHRNTLMYRLDKFEKQTGLDLKDFDDAIACRIGMMIWELMA